MAYMDQAKKAKINAELKNVVPAGWKWSLSVHNHSTIVLTIRSAPVDLLGMFNATMAPEYPSDRKYAQVYHKHIEGRFGGGEVEATMERIATALNLDNFDKSDSQTDYFHVGHYVEINLGTYEKPFVCTGEPVAA